MRRIFLPLILVCVVACTQSQEIQYVNDYASVFTEDQQTELALLYKMHEEKTTNQIVLVTTYSLMGEASVKDFAVEFGRRYGIGQKGKDNGLVIALDMKNRDIFIATGYGMEIVFEDHEVKSVLDSCIIPQLKEGEYYQGILNGSVAIINHLELPENMVFTEK